jgi:hypothetical protein
MWCPRCQAALLAPYVEQPAADPHWGRPTATGAPGVSPALPPGYRWIAVRPGAPQERRRRRVLSPTPRYRANPGWGLYHDIGPVPSAPAIHPIGPSADFVRSTLRATAIVLAVAAGIHAVRYILLVINRTTLLHPLVAGAALWLGVAASVAALAAVIRCAIVLTRWLIARRLAVYTHYRRDDPRKPGELRAGCLVPLVNLVWAPVYVIETATIEGLYSRLRKPIIVWWVLWVLSTLVAVFAIATSLATDAQGIADNTVTSTLAYLLALAVVLAVARVHEGFVRKPVDRPAHRWVVVESPAQPPAPQQAAVVGPEDQQPAA